MAIRYKFVELTVVTDESLETAVNEWVGKGWQLEGIRFVTTEGTRRPRAITSEDEGDEPLE